MTNKRSAWNVIWEAKPTTFLALEKPVLVIYYDDRYINFEKVILTEAQTSELLPQTITTPYNTEAQKHIFDWQSKDLEELVELELRWKKSWKAETNSEIEETNNLIEGLRTKNWNLIRDAINI